MPSIEILGTGRVDERGSAFPQAVQLPNGDILCSFSVGGGAFAQGGTDWARSTDGGKTWRLEGTILPMTASPKTVNHLKLTLSPDGKTIYAYGSRSYLDRAKRYEQGHNEPVFCRSTDGGRTWSAPQVVPLPHPYALEISHGMLALSSGRLLAPSATYPTHERLGEQVYAVISDDGGKTWPKHAVVFQDPNKKFGYLEQKLAELAPGRVIACCWTVTLGGVVDQPDSFTLSDDDGATWAPPVSTGIRGQTMTPISLGGDRLLVLYNRRYGDQGVVMLLVTFTKKRWTVRHEGIMYDARTQRQWPPDVKTGDQEWAGFEFGFPTAVKLRDGTFLATHWCKEQGKVGIRWTKLRVDW